MEKPIRVLIIEDSEDDVLLAIRELKKGDYQPSYEQVEDAEGMRRSLENGSWDVVLCDYQMPKFNGIKAIELLKETGLDIPLIIVSGVIGEEMAAECMRLGAHDFFMKGNLTRLASAVKRELKEAESRVRLRAAEEKLRESEETLRRITSSAQDAIIMMNDQGSISFWNEAAQRIFGYSHGEIMGKNLHSLLAPGRFHEFFHKGFAAFKETGRGPSLNKISELSGRKKDGTEFPIELSLSSVEIRGKWNAIGIVRDITHRKQMEKEQKELDKKVQQTQRMESIGTLAGGIAHDFNNLLSAIIGFTELSLDGVEKGSVLADNLQEIYAAGNRAKELVKQILTVARQADESVTPTQIDIIAKEALKLIRASIPTTIEIKQYIKSDSLILGNPSQVHQILMNLCTNAAHAMEKHGGVLTVGLKDVAIPDAGSTPGKKLKPGDYLQLTVSDTGIGIPGDVIGSIFEPYFTTKTPGEGTGIGLALVHSIVESSGGRIDVESELGKGTVFTILFPITRKRKAYDLDKTDVLPSGREQILFVDDEDSIARVSSRILEHLGYVVTTMTDSTKALELFRSDPHAFDLVITDMTMPKMTGDRLSAEMMKIRPDITVILCTGYSRNISDQEAREAGIKAFAYKPIGSADLAKTVRKVLDEAKSSAND